MFAKKTTYGQEKTMESPSLRKAKSGVTEYQRNEMKTRILKNHSDILKGVTVARGLAQANERHSNYYTYYIFKNILERLIRFKEEVDEIQELREITQIVGR